MAEMDAEIDAALAEDEDGDNSDGDEDAALPDRLLASPSSSSSERGALLITAFVALLLIIDDIRLSASSAVRQRCVDSVSYPLVAW